MRQLQREDPPPAKDLGDAALIQLLRIQGNDYNRSSKRPHNEPDDGSSDKPPTSRPSKLRERNKMLASLLAKPSEAPTLYSQPQVKMIPDIPHSRTPMTVGQPQNPKQQQQSQPLPQQQQQQQVNNQKMIGMQQQQQQSLHHRTPNQVRKASDNYLNQQMPTQHELSKNQQVKFQKLIKSSSLFHTIFAS